MQFLEKLICSTTILFFLVTVILFIMATLWLLFYGFVSTFNVLRNSFLWRHRAAASRYERKDHPIGSNSFVMIWKRLVNSMYWIIAKVQGGAPTAHISKVGVKRQLSSSLLSSSTSLFHSMSSAFPFTNNNNGNYNNNNESNQQHVQHTQQRQKRRVVFAQQPDGRVAEQRHCYNPSTGSPREERRSAGEGESAYNNDSLGSPEACRVGTGMSLANRQKTPPPRRAAKMKMVLHATNKVEKENAAVVLLGMKSGSLPTSSTTTTTMTTAQSLWKPPMEEHGVKNHNRNHQQFFRHHGRIPLTSTFPPVSKLGREQGVAGSREDTPFATIPLDPTPPIPTHGNSNELHHQN